MRKSTIFLFMFAASLLLFAFSIQALAMDSGDFSVSNGVLTKYVGNEKNLVIPDNLGITEIGENAFLENKNLESVELPKGLIKIGKSSFERCYSLKSVAIPDTVKSIGDRAFSTCSALSSISIPDSVTSIGAYAFTGSTITAVFIPESVESIGDGAFSNCCDLKSVNVRGNIDSMGNGVFSRTRIPEPIIINNGKLLCYVPAAYTEYVIPETVSEIGGGAVDPPFSKLTSITIPDSVTTIGDGAFSMCSGLTSISLPKSVTSIGKAAFSRCSRLASINIPDGIKAIDDYTFTDCFALTSIELPDSVTSIGNLAFSCCSLTSVALPKNLTTIGKCAFNGNPELSSLIIPDSVTSIGEEAFAACRALVLSGEKGSYAQQYAVSNKLNFREIFIAKPVQYTLSVNGQNKNLWAYEIEGGIYFKLRDIAMALNGTNKQFEVSWSPESNDVYLSAGKSYTPIGDELNSNAHLQSAEAKPATATFIVDGRPAAGLSYNVDNANYVKLSELAATLKFESNCNEKSRKAKIDTLPEPRAIS